jgi:hypothetical protein
MLPNGKIVRDVCQSNVFPWDKNFKYFLKIFGFFVD